LTSGKKAVIIHLNKIWDVVPTETFAKTLRGIHSMAEITFGDLKEREREARRELIVNTAKKLFSEKSFKSVTVRDIAKGAGISTGTIYRYYESLDELFLDVFFSDTNEIIRIIEGELKKGGGCTIRKFSEVYIGYLNENTSYYQMMSYFMPRGMLTDEEIEKINPIMQEVIDLIERLIKAVGHKGDTQLMARALFSALNGIMTSYAQYPGSSVGEIQKYTLVLAGYIADFFEMGARKEYY
jgi:AcrR family transcriptional regulator